MEEEINLRQYVKTLIRYWKWIVGVAVIAAITALAVALVMPRTYKATALVIVTRPRYILQFDSRLQTVYNVQPAYKVYPELATSDGVLQALLNPSNNPSENIKTLQDLRGMLSAKVGADPSIVRLVASSSDPAQAAHMANAWAKVFVAWANEMYGDQDTEQVRFFESQLQRAQTELEAAEQALIEFEAQNPALLLKNQLDSSSRLQAEYLAEQRDIAHTIQDVQGLRNQLTEHPGGAPALADQLTALFLQLKSFNAQANAPLQFQIPEVGAFSNQTAEEQVVWLDSLSKTLAAKSAEIDTQLVKLEPQILDLQQQLRAANTSEERLIRARDVARETYLTLARKVQEVRIASQDVGDPARLASEAAVPEQPAGPRKILIVTAAAALGLTLAVIGVFIIEWWREGTSPTIQPRTEKG